MADQRIQIREDTQRAAKRIEHVSCLSNPPDDVAQPFGTRPLAILHPDDFTLAEMVGDGLDQVCPDRQPSSIYDKDRCTHSIGM